MIVFDFFGNFTLQHSIKHFRVKHGVLSEFLETIEKPGNYFGPLTMERVWDFVKKKKTESP